MFVKEINTICEGATETKSALCLQDSCRRNQYGWWADCPPRQSPCLAFESVYCLPGSQKVHSVQSCVRGRPVPAAQCGEEAMPRPPPKRLRSVAQPLFPRRCPRTWRGGCEAAECVTGGALATTRRKAAEDTGPAEHTLRSSACVANSLRSLKHASESWVFFCQNS